MFVGGRSQVRTYVRTHVMETRGRHQRFSPILSHWNVQIQLGILVSMDKNQGYWLQNAVPSSLEMTDVYQPPCLAFTWAPGL